MFKGNSYINLQKIYSHSIKINVYILMKFLIIFSFIVGYFELLFYNYLYKFAKHEL